MSAVLLELEADQFQRPTNCPPWDLRELVVHTAASIELGDEFGTPDPGAPLRSAADYYRRPERATPRYRGQNVAQAQDPDRHVQVPAVGAMRLGDWTVTRVISVAAHGVDVALTLERVPWTTSSALAVMRGVFLSLLGAELPPRLAWDDQVLLEAATGRRAPTDQDRMLLGPLQERFPLLS